MAQPEMIQRLKRISRLSMLPDEILADLTRVVTAERHPRGAVICQQGELEEKLYGIELGDILVQVTINGHDIEVAHLTEGDVFGERALMGNRPRTATIIAETTVDLLVLHRSDYQALTHKHPALQRILVGPDATPLLREVPLFSHLSEEELAALSAYVGIIFFPPARRVVEQGDMGLTMYVVSEGELVAYRQDERGRSRPVKALGPGDDFGETSLLVGEIRDATVITKTYTELCYINKASFGKFLDLHPKVQSKLQPRPEVERKREAPPFSGQKPGETIAIMDGKHWVAYVRAIRRPGLLLGLLGALLATVDILWLRSPEGATALTWLPTAMTILWMLTVVGVFFWHWIDWRNDYHIVTTQRVIHIENELWRATSRDEVPIHQVQNVEIERDLWGGVLDYGHVRITTAGAAGGSLELEDVHDPEEFQHAIFEQIDLAKFRAVAEERAELRQAIRQAIGISVLEETILEEPPPAKPRRLSWIALLTQNRVAKRLGLMMTESGIGAFLRHPHLPREEIREENRVIWRKHWSILLLSTWRPLALSIVLSGLIAAALMLRLGLFYLPGVPASYFDVVLLILSLLAAPAFGWLVWKMEDWRNDLYIVTNTHIIDIERTPLLLRESRRQASLDKIQNTNASTQGFWAGVFRLGNVNIETAGEGTFTFSRVRNPHKVQAEIDKRRAAYEARLRQEQAAQRRAELAKWFDAYNRVTREVEAMERRRAQQMLPTDWIEEPEDSQGV